MDIDCLHKNSKGPCLTCGGTGGWRRAAYLDMIDPNTNCPSDWNETGYSKRTCGRATNGTTTCDSAYFPVSGGEYSQVCGKIRAYPWGWTPGFVGYSSIDYAYILQWSGCDAWQSSTTHLQLEQWRMILDTYMLTDHVTPQ